jgi:CHAT domain-containing protein
LATERLAGLLNEQHSDPWLADLIKRRKQDDTAALLALRDAIIANQKQHADQAIKLAGMAALAFRESHNVAGELRARYEEIYAYQRSMNGEACLRHASVLEPSLRSTPYHQLLSEFLLEKAVCEKRAGRPGEIDNPLNESSKLAKEFKYQVLQLRILGLAAGFKKEAEVYDVAWSLASKGIGLYWEGSYPAERLYQVYEVAAECAERQRHWHSAEALRRHAIRIRESMGASDKQDAIMLGTLYLDLATILIALKKDIPAAEAAAHADSILKLEAAEPTTRKFRSTVLVQLAKLQMESGNNTLALSTLLPILEYARKTGDQVTTLQCYGVLGDIYLGSHDTEKAVTAYQTGIVFSENALSTLSSSLDRLTWTSAAEGIYRGLVRAWLLQRREADAWRLWEWYKGRSLQVSAMTGSTHLRSWAEVQARFLQPIQGDKSPVRITYATFVDGLQIWVNQGGRTSSHWVPVPQQVIERKVQDFFDDCADSSSELSSVWKTGEDLYSLLWQPIASELPGSGIIVAELDGPLQNVVLEALRIPAHKYLAEQYNIVYSPGIYMDPTLKPGLKVDNATRVFLLDASAVTGLDPIPSQEREVQFIARQFSQSKIVNGAGTTLGDLRSGLGKREVFFFAGHAVRDSEGSALLINPGFFARAWDFRPQDLGSLQLAVLAACSTGSTDRNGLLDTHSLSNAFLAAGVPNVIASRWDVESDSTTDLMERFAVHLHKGQTVVTSLSRARQGVLIEIQHPYFWAGFYVAGQTN